MRSDGSDDALLGDGDLNDAFAEFENEHDKNPFSLSATATRRRRGAYGVQTVLDSREEGRLQEDRNLNMPFRSPRRGREALQEDQESATFWPPRRWGGRGPPVYGSHHQNMQASPLS